MKIRNKRILGMQSDGKKLEIKYLYVNYISDFKGKTLSIDNNETQFTIPFDEIYKMIKEDK